MVLSALASSAAGFKAQAQAPVLHKKRPFPVRRASDESAGGCKKKRIVAGGSGMLARVQAARGPAQTAAWFDTEIAAVDAAERRSAQAAQSSGGVFAAQNHGLPGSMVGLYDFPAAAAHSAAAGFGGAVVSSQQSLVSHSSQAGDFSSQSGDDRTLASLVPPPTLTLVSCKFNCGPAMPKTWSGWSKSTGKGIAQCELCWNAARMIHNIAKRTGKETLDKLMSTKKDDWEAWCRMVRLLRAIPEKLKSQTAKDKVTGCLTSLTTSISVGIKGAVIYKNRKRFCDWQQEQYGITREAAEDKWQVVVDTAPETMMIVDGETESRAPVRDEPRVEMERKKTLSIALQQHENVNCPGAAAEALERQNELARLTGELTTHAFGGFNHGLGASAVNPTAMNFGKLPDVALPAANKQPFPALTAAGNFEPGLPGYLPSGLEENLGEGQEDRRFHNIAALKGTDEFTREKRQRVLVAAAELLAEYAPAAKNTASKVVKTLKKMKIERPGPELAVHLENYTLGCEYWKSLPVAARTMSAGRCETAMLNIQAHAAAVQAADAKLQEHIQELMTGREALSKKARQLGVAYAKEKAKVLSGFQSSPSVLTAWLVRSGTLDVTVEGREAVEKAADTMLKAAGADLSIPFAKPTMLPGGGKDAVTAQLSDLLPAVQEQLAIAIMNDKARLSQSAMVATQLNDKCDALLDTANWVPAAWQAHGWAPNSVTGWCSPWLLSQRAGTTRMTSMDMPTNGMPTLYEVVEGQGWFFCWHADDAEMQGTNITKQYQHLLKNAHPTDSVKWMASSVAIATVNKEDKIWVPFGYFAAVMSAGGVPLLLLGMPWINSKVCAQNRDAAVLVLQNQQRIFGQLRSRAGSRRGLGRR